MSSMHISGTLMIAVTAMTSILYAPSRIYAQSGECCAQTQTTVINCKTAGCSGTVNYRSCLDPNGTGATIWKIAEAKCCDEVFTIFSENTGRTNCGSPVSKTPSPLENAVYAEGLWVRNCKGRFVFAIRLVG